MILLICDKCKQKKLIHDTLHGEEDFCGWKVEDSQENDIVTCLDCRLSILESQHLNDVKETIDGSSPSQCGSLVSSFSSADINIQNKTVGVVREDGKQGPLDAEETLQDNSEEEQENTLGTSPVSTLSDRKIIHKVGEMLPMEMFFKLDVKEAFAKIKNKCNSFENSSGEEDEIDEILQYIDEVIGPELQ